MQIRNETPGCSSVERGSDTHCGGKPRHLSEVLQDIADASAKPEERISLGMLIESFGSQAFATLIFVFALPVSLPIAIPGISAILGAPLLLLTWQLMRGQEQPWLPDVMRNRSFRRRDFAAVLRRILPWMRRIERLLGPRLVILTTPRAAQCIGFLAFALALILFLPVPFGNTVPALSIAILALAMLERDGIAVIVGALVGLVGIGLVSGVIFALIKGAVFLIWSIF